MLEEIDNEVLGEDKGIRDQYLHLQKVEVASLETVNKNLPILIQLVG